MKRLLCILLVIAILSIPITGCGNKKIKVAICIPESSSVDTGYLTEQLEAKGYEVSVFVEKDDQNGQNQQIATLFKEKYELLIIEPLICSAAEDIMNHDKRKDTALIFINYYGTPPDAVGNTAFLCMDTVAIGNAQTQAANKLPNGGDINGDGIVSYAILSTQEADTLSAAQIDALQSGLSQMELLTICYGGDPSQGAQRVCNELLATYGRDLELLICVDSRLTAEAVSAITANGRLPGSDLYVIGAGESPALTSLLENGSLNATVIPDRTEGGQIIKTAVAMLSESAYETNNAFHYQIIPE